MLFSITIAEKAIPNKIRVVHIFFNRFAHWVLLYLSLPWIAYFIFFTSAHAWRCEKGTTEHERKKNAHNVYNVQIEWNNKNNADHTYTLKTV